MWKKDRQESPETVPPSSPSPERRPASPSERSVIGPSITMKGEVSGEEDLLIEGQFEGQVNLQKNVVTVGPQGRVTANILGRIVHIEGEVCGDCTGTEQVILHRAGRVKGNIGAPRVTVEDGARLQGTIDTGAPLEEEEHPEEPRQSKPHPKVVEESPASML